MPRYKATWPFTMEWTVVFDAPSDGAAQAIAEEIQAQAEVDDHGAEYPVEIDGVTYRPQLLVTTDVAALRVGPTEPSLAPRPVRGQPGLRVVK